MIDDLSNVQSNATAGAQVDGVRDTSPTLSLVLRAGLLVMRFPGYLSRSRGSHNDSSHKPTARNAVHKTIIVGFVLPMLLALWASPAAAHTGFGFSVPSGAEVVEGPVTEITLTFVGVAEPTGDGFVVRDADGTLLIPDSVTSVDNLTWLIRFDESLSEGLIGVRWMVAAPDAHPIDGSFSFTISSPATTSAPAPADSDVGQTPNQSDDLTDFLQSAAPTASRAAVVATIARVLTISGATIGIGGLSFAALVLRGSPRDIRSVLYWTRRAGVLLIIGALTEAVAQVAISNGRWSALWSASELAGTLGASFGVAIGLRLTSAFLITGGTRLDTHHATRAADPIAAIGGFAGGGTSAIPVRTQVSQPNDHAWRTNSGGVAFTGVLLLLLSFVFDGHTVTEGPRQLHAVVNVIHVTSASIWAGGVIMLVHVVWSRHRRNVDVRALNLALRFSVVAGTALAVAGAAGLVLAMVILGGPSELWTTPWGRVLAAKVALVAVGGAAGAYNHVVLIPEMERHPNDEYMARQFKAIVTIEAVALLLVIVATAMLVAAASQVS